MALRIPRQAGFTLIEIVVSLLIFAVLSVLAWQGLYQIVSVEQRSREQSVAQNEINRAWAIMVQDLLHLRSRPVRNRFGDLEPAYTTAIDPYLLLFSRGGLPVLDGILPTGMQRVGYLIDENSQLLRRTWPLEDGYRDDAGRSQVLLHEVAYLQFEQLDSGNYYQPNWPPINEELIPRQVPRMTRVTLTLNSGVEMTRTLPGVQTYIEPQSRGGDGDGDGDGGRNP